MRESRNVRPALRADYSDERDTKRIRPDQERETANGNGEVDLMHGRFLTGSVSAEHPIVMFSTARTGLEAS